MAHLTSVLARLPTTWPSLVNETTDGIVRSPLLILTTVGVAFSSSRYAMQLRKTYQIQNVPARSPPAGASEGHLAGPSGEVKMAWLCDGAHSHLVQEAHSSVHRVMVAVCHAHQ